MFFFTIFAGPDPDPQHWPVVKYLAWPEAIFHTTALNLQYLHISAVFNRSFFSLPVDASLVWKGFPVFSPAGGKPTLWRERISSGEELGMLLTKK